MNSRFLSIPLHRPCPFSSVRVRFLRTQVDLPSFRADARAIFRRFWNPARQTNFAVVSIRQSSLPENPRVQRWSGVCRKVRGGLFELVLSTSAVLELVVKWQCGRIVVGGVGLPFPAREGVFRLVFRGKVVFLFPVSERPFDAVVGHALCNSKMWRGT